MAPIIGVLVFLSRCPTERSYEADSPPPFAEGAFLTDNKAWILIPEETDPWFAGRSPSKIPCVAADTEVEESAGPEGNWLSLRTQNCGYATLSQPLLQDIPACTALVVHIWYFKFLPPKETTGLGYTVTVTIGDSEDAPLFTLSGDQVPDESGLIYEIVQTEREYKAGEPVYFHMSNHGSNSWEFIQLRVLDADE